MFTSKRLDFKKQLIMSWVLAALALVFTLGLGSKAFAYDDGVWWGHCNDRYTVGTVNFTGGKVTAHGCSNGYFFVTTTADSHSSVVASITRSNPWGQELTSAYGYSNSTNMLARLSGACYDVWGSVTNNGTHGNGFRFCW